MNKTALHTHRAIKLPFVFIMFMGFSQAFARQDGMPFIRNYTPQEYKASPQNWSVVQDRRGIMYFGNNDGVLEYDGVNWQLIKLPGVGPIAVDSVGRLFVGLDNDIGYLQPDKTGNYRFYSLKPLIPDIHKDINLCSRVYVLGERVLFQTSDKIYIYNSDKITVLTSDEGFYLSFVVHNRFYVIEPGNGLYFLKDDNLELIAGTGHFAGEEIISMMPYRQHEILLVTRFKGIFIFSPENQAKLIKPVEFKEVDNFLLRKEVYCGTSLDNGDYALGTITAGVLVFNANGAITAVYNKNTGLQDNSIYNIYCDQNSQLWSALDNGISLIHNTIPFKQYTDKSGLNGATMCLRFFKNHFYVGTGQYLHIQNQQGNFEPIPGTESQNFNLYEANGSLLLANLAGISEIKEKQAIPVANTSHISALVFGPLPGKSNYLLTGATDGLYLLEYKNSAWKLKHKISGFNKPAYKVDADKEGNIWVSTFLDIYKLQLNSALDFVISFQKCTPEQGLPSTYAMAFTLKSGEVVFCTEKGVYRFLQIKNRFEPHPDFRMLKGKVIQFVQGKNGDIWFEQTFGNGNYEKGVLKFQNGRFVAFKTPFYKFNNMGSGDCPFNICPAPDGSVFFGTDLGLLQYHPSSDINFNKSFNTLIRRVYAKDSLLFGGAVLSPIPVKGTKGTEISYSQGDILFHYAATFFEDAEDNLYSYRLIGSDTLWSSWTNDHKKEYTNLPEGRYRFEVKSKNQYQIPGSTDSYSFRILPPWYRSWWAYVSYVILLILFLILLMKLYTRRLAKQKEHLEKLVTDRTAQVLEQKKEILENNEVLTVTNNKLNEINKELNQANEKLISTLVVVNTQKSQIEKAHKQIKEQNTELMQYRDHLEQLVDERTREFLLAKNKAEEADRLKTAFLQNMSHEIRTPMNGILGFINMLDEPDLDDERKMHYIDIINKSGERLLNTINDIIEIARIESNQIAVHYSEIDIAELMEVHFHFFKQQAEKKGLLLKLSEQIINKQAIVESDKHILDNILTNLINNAIKFTIKGTVEFGNYLEKDALIFYVKDTGIGIPVDRHEAIFERFVQADIGNTRAYEGSGLGLAIVKGYLELLHGAIWVKSETGKGSTFFFSIPYKPVQRKTMNVTERSEPNRALKKKLHILVAEDDENSFLYIRSILKNITETLLYASNGNDAVRLIKENPKVSLILMDIKMPELDGFDAIRQIRQFNKTVIIIAQTAYALTGDREKALEAGSNDYITKPINAKDLMDLIQKYVG